MRILEILLLLTSIYCAFYSVKALKLNHKIAKIIILTILIFHFVLEGWRWQMIPVYLVLLSYFFLLKRNFSKNKFLKYFVPFVVISFSAVSWFLATSLPIFSLPNPTGNHGIGSTYLQLNSNRDEIITSNKNDQRQLMIKVWYPARIKNETHEPYLNKAERIGFAKKYKLPETTFDYLKHIQTNTFQNPKPSKGKFPVLIFSHGHYSQASGYYSLIEDIVSHGYIVLSVNHTYESAGTLFTNGEMKFYDENYDRHNISNEEMAKLTWTSNQDFKNAKNNSVRRRAADNILKKYIANNIGKRWSLDITDVINSLSSNKMYSLLEKRIDTTRIGIIGHSQGGSVAGNVTLQNKKIKAGVNLDGVQWGQMIDTTLHKPFLYIASDWGDDHPDFNRFAYEKSTSDIFYSLKLKNSGHASFMDIPFLINIKAVNQSGSIDKKTAIKTTTKMIVSFFNKYLKDENIELTKTIKENKDLEVIK